jgi:hypothetical protein
LTTPVLLAALVAVAARYLVSWWWLERRRGAGLVFAVGVNLVLGALMSQACEDQAWRVQPDPDVWACARWQLSRSRWDRAHS